MLMSSSFSYSDSTSYIKLTKVLSFPLNICVKFEDVISNFSRKCSVRWQCNKTCSSDWTSSLHTHNLSSRGVRHHRPNSILKLWADNLILVYESRLNSGMYTFVYNVGVSRVSREGPRFSNLHLSRNQILFYLPVNYRYLLDLKRILNVRVLLYYFSLCWNTLTFLD